MTDLYICGLDLESTGLKIFDGDRIVETCLQVYRISDRKRVIDFTQRTNAQGRKMNAKAQKVHGISSADLIGEPNFETIAPKIDAIIKKCIAVVTHNGEHFDLPLLAVEMNLAGIPLPSDLKSFDTMRNGMFASYDQKPPALRELCYSMGVEYDPAKAHAADYDVDVMMEAFFRAADQGFFDLQSVIDKHMA